uniref:KN motif and ankyrin repeat domain-containing protein 2 n=1 Tax=Molossus molossus TaxID=27622 RepID=A0A7J8I769_MOLMO|nr:KN motif and ankyrin repeat domains 2 [Molossus molossus]
MAQVLHVPAPFPGTPGPASPPAFPGKETDPPYSVETPYGYRLDLDFLKYVDDIEKGHTLRRVAVQRRPRLGSLPRGPGSWWTSTESLCSNASGDSRHSAYSYCGRGFYPQYGALEARSGFNPRVERTLLDARRRLEDQTAEPTDLTAHQRSLQFVGVNGGCESSSEDSSTAENFSDNESTENETPEPEARVPSVAKAPQLRPTGTAVAKNNREECQLSRESQHVPAAEGASGSNVEEIRMELSPDLISACLALEKYLDNPNALTERELKVAYTTVLQEWLRLACRSDAHPELVRRHLVTFRAMSSRLLDYVVNIADSNGNTALHYSVSHANFPVVRQLLDSGVCQVDKQNRAGYSPIMLTALATLKTQDDIETLLQLFRLGDVNAKASQAGQTALMLAVSHGRVDVVKALLACEADVNVQDDDGSTALMCACEHGHKEITSLLLAVPSCDISLTDRDGSTALMVALDAGQSEIASMLYSRMNIKCSFAPMSDDESPASSSAEE